VGGRNGDVHLVDRRTVDGRNGADSLWMLRKTRDDRETIRETAGRRNDDRQLAEKQERLGRWTDKQTGSRRIDRQPAVETTTDSRRTDGQSADEMVTDSRQIDRQPVVETEIDSRRKTREDRQTNRETDRQTGSWR